MKATEGLYKILVLRDVVDAEERFPQIGLTTDVNDNTKFKNVHEHKFRDWWIHLTISIDVKICSVRAVLREMF